MQAVAVVTSGCYVTVSIKEWTVAGMNRERGGFQKNPISKMWFKQFFKG